MDYIVLYKPSLTAARLTVVIYDLRREGGLLMITTHAAHNGGTLFLEKSDEIQAVLVKNVPYQGIKICTHPVKVHRWIRLIYCTQSRRAIRNGNTLPESNARWRITKLMREFSGATLPERALAANGNSYARD